MESMDAFDTLVRACGIGVLCAFCLMLIGRQSGYSVVLRIGGGALLFGILLLLVGQVVGVLEEFSELSGSSYVRDAFSVMLKGLGVALLGRFCADICRDCGESTLASGVESIGKAVILSLALPMLLETLRLASGLLDTL